MKNLKFLFAALIVLTLYSCSNKYSESGEAPNGIQPALAMESEEYAVDDFAPPQDFNTEEYDRIYDNPFLEAFENPVSTFSIDVDAASYSNCRRFLNDNRLPPKDAVRIEEFINYFSYSYPQPAGEHPFSISMESGPCPWNKDHQLLHIGLKGKDIEKKSDMANNLVFLFDVSGSMEAPDKLPLLKKAFRLLINELGEKDKASIVVYAGASGVVLPPTSCDKKDKILSAMEKLSAGGSTAGSEGIELAYKLAKENYDSEGNNRVILATDGDFNVGPSSDAELTRLIEEKRKEGIFLTVLGFGTGNYKDSKMEKLADKGNGNYAYIDNILEAKKVLVNEIGSTLLTIAKDVKIQIEFNPAKVKEYRLIGYENRMLATEDFDDDKKDAGELGAGHTVTALYEIAPQTEENLKSVKNSLKYQESKLSKEALDSPNMLTIKFRYKKPDEDISKLITKEYAESKSGRTSITENFNFSAAVAAFGMLLRGSEYKGEANYALVKELAARGRGQDVFGYRSEFLRLVEIAEAIEGTE